MPKYIVGLIQGDAARIEVEADYCHPATLFVTFYKKPVGAGEIREVVTLIPTSNVAYIDMVEEPAPDA